VINEALLDWQNRAQNYLAVLTLATNEAPDGQSFVTEYAGSSTPMRGVLDPDGRFGYIGQLAAQSTASGFAKYLAEHGYFTLPTAASQFGGGGPGGPGFPGGGFSPQAFDSVLRSILQRAVVMPPRLAMMGVTEPEFYGRLFYYLNEFRMFQPEAFIGWVDTIDAPAVANEIDEKIVRPTRDAGLLFRVHPYLTRLFTFLDPDQMTVDPAFDFNPSLPELSNIHQATMTISCLRTGGSSGPVQQARILRLPNGRRLFFAPDDPSDVWLRVTMPNSQRIEHLPLEGAPAVELDNTDRIDVTIAGRNEDIARRYSQWNWGSPMAGPTPPQPNPNDPVTPAPPAAPMDPVRPKSDSSGCASTRGGSFASPVLALLALGYLARRRRTHL
jgi:MYXO-CTERM domain-containing protein